MHSQLLVILFRELSDLTGVNSTLLQRVLQITCAVFVIIQRLGGGGILFDEYGRLDTLWNVPEFCTVSQRWAIRHSPSTTGWSSS